MKKSATIDKILSILKDDSFNRMNLSNLKGFLGELYVKQKLESEGWEIEHKGNQSNVDLINHQNKIQIDVKLSSVKYHGKNKYKLWTWALRQSSKQNMHCTHFVCVALDAEFNPIAYYLVNNSDNLSSFPDPNEKRFKNVTKILAIADCLNEFSENQVIQECHKLLDSKTIVKVLPEENLKDKIISI